MEKNEQVPMMGKIYTKADKVLIWLGPFPSEISEDRSEQAKFIQKLKKAGNGEIRRFSR